MQDESHVHRPHFERCDWCEATVYFVENDSPALHVCTLPVGHAPARKERSMMQTPQIVRLERRQCSAHTPDGPCQRKAEAVVLFDRTGKRIILSSHGAATGSCLSHCHDQIAIGDAHDAGVAARLKRESSKD